MLHCGKVIMISPLLYAHVHSRGDNMYTGIRTAMVASCGGVVWL